jgi:hypothetical protein
MRAALPVDPLVVDEAEVGFVNQLRGLKRSRRLPAQEARGALVELLVDVGCQPIDGVAGPARGGEEDFGGVP